MSDQSKKPDLGLLEEDDEFEEFPAEGIFYNDRRIIVLLSPTIGPLSLPCSCESMSPHSEIVIVLKYQRPYSTAILNHF